MSAPRTFLTRVEATGLLGLGCASQINQGRLKPDPAAELRLACRYVRRVYEAKGREALHAQIVLRLVARRQDVDPSRIESGWTVATSWLLARRAAAVRFSDTLVVEPPVAGGST